MQITDDMPHCGVTFFPTVSARRKKFRPMTLPQLRDEILRTSRSSKEALPWLKLATFGTKRTPPPENCLRHDANVLAVSGIELDYDRKEMTLDEAIGIAEKAKLRALFYTSASYTDVAPKWRILLPLSKPLLRGAEGSLVERVNALKAERARLVGRVNGLYGGIFDGASFNLSQSYYFGAVNNNPAHRAVITEGDYIDLRPEFDDGAMARPKGNGKDASAVDSEHPLEVAAGELRGLSKHVDAEQALADMEYEGRDGNSIHETQLSVTASLLSSGVPIEDVVERVLQATREAAGPEGRAWDWGPHGKGEEGKIRKLCDSWLRKHPEIGEGEALAPAEGGEAPAAAEEGGEPAAAEVPNEEQGPVWPVLAQEALHGLAGEVVRTIEPHTESDPAAILVQFLVAFGNVIGRGPFVQIEGDKHFTNLFAVVVGESSKSRKGTSGGRVRQIMNGVDEEWTDNCIQSGLSSGEGLIWAIRDDEHGFDKKGNPTVQRGVKDKRLFLDEREFSQVLVVMKREGNTVGRVVRVAWDGHPLKALTKNAKGSVKNPHISVVGHITRDELRTLLDAMLMANGFANRFLYACARRSKELPHGGNLSASALAALSQKISKVVTPLATLAVSEGRIGVKEKKDEDENAEHFDVFGQQQSNGLIEVTMNAPACALWESMYHELTNGPSGALGAICGRAESQTVRLAMLYALLDGKKEIEPVHLRAALAVWKYCEDSARHIFGESIGSAFADELLRVLRENGGMGRMQISNTFQRHQSQEKISAALRLLRDHGLIKPEMRAASRRRQGGGRQVEFWVPVAQGGGQTSQTSQAMRSLVTQSCAYDVGTS
jgi:hypothetical protein